MENLLTVVKERDIALNMLETGLSGEPCEVTARNALGIKYRRVESEHLVPKYMNRKYKLLHSKYEPWMAQWILKYEEVKPGGLPSFTGNSLCTCINRQTFNLLVIYSAYWA